MFFFPRKGLIALDIDGTVTANTHAIHPEVIDALIQIEKEGWGFIFITGRPFEWGFHSLQSLPFSYALGVQNGALLLEMPSKKILSRRYLSKKIIPLMETISEEQLTDFVVYSGLENDDRCYYRPHRLPESILPYVLQRSAFLNEKWEALHSFSDMPISEFSSIKFFAQEKEALILSQQIENKLGFHAPPNRDPYNPNYFVIQATDNQATKGHVLREFIRLIGHSGPIIAAGDDYNDYSMLQIATVKIVMANAPADLLRIADIVAPPASQEGIIEGLAQAIHCIKRM